MSDLKDTEIKLSDSEILNRVISNLLDASVITPAEINSTINKLKDLPRVNLLIWMLESHYSRELANSINSHLN